jgi:hypothetical protein
MDADSPINNPHFVFFFSFASFFRAILQAAGFSFPPGILIFFIFFIEDPETPVGAFHRSHPTFPILPRFTV